MPQGQTRRFFISYGGQVDRKYATYVKARLDALRIACIISEDRVSNEDLWVKILADIRRSSHMILIVSKNTLSTAWPHQEVGYFIAKNSKRRVFVLLRSKRQVEVKQLGVLHGKENIRAERLRRSPGAPSSGKNEFSWECALDKLTTMLLHKGMVSMNHGRLRLRTAVPCCGLTKYLNTVVSMKDDGKTIIVAPYECPKHRRAYNRDALTWALVPAQELTVDSLEVSELRSFRASPESQPVTHGPEQPQRPTNGPEPPE